MPVSSIAKQKDGTPLTYKARSQAERRGSSRLPWFFRLEANKTAIERLAEEQGIEQSLHEEFAHAVFAAVDKFKSKKARDALPEQPLREYRSREGIIDYIRSPEGFGPWLQAGQLNRSLIRSKSPKAYQALTNWLRGHDLPADLTIPGQAEMASIKAQALVEESPDQLKAAHALYQRNRRAARRLE